MIVLLLFIGAVIFVGCNELADHLEKKYHYNDAKDQNLCISFIRKKDSQQYHTYAFPSQEGSKCCKLSLHPGEYRIIPPEGYGIIGDDTITIPRKDFHTSIRMQRNGINVFTDVCTYLL